MTVWFTSDTHFGHRNIAKYQPNRVEEFGMESDEDIQTMNEAMVAQWNSQVQPGDRVIHLGDFAMGKIDETLPYVAQLNGTIDLIMGNHDRPHPVCTRVAEKRDAWAERYLAAGFNSVQLDGRWDFDGIPVVMSHFPYSGDHEEEDRYPGWRPDDNGLVLVHGHVHGMWQIMGRQVNVGMDAHGGRLLTEAEVAAMVAEAARN
jgi:calcineurin-like phosphoesterase family protein